jgi:hypothetical protein
MAWPYFPQGVLRCVLSLVVTVQSECCVEVVKVRLIWVNVWKAQLTVCKKPVRSMKQKSRVVRLVRWDDDLWEIQFGDVLTTAKKGQFTMLQPRREHISECIGRVRLDCRVEMGQGELFLGFPRQSTALFYINKLNTVTTCKQSMSGLYNFAEDWYTQWRQAGWYIARQDGSNRCRVSLDLSWPMTHCHDFITFYSIVIPCTYPGFWVTTLLGCAILCNNSHSTYYDLVMNHLIYFIISWYHVTLSNVTLLLCL